MPHYPVLQPDTRMAIWSTIVDTFTLFDLSDQECAAEIARWHTGDATQYVADTRAGKRYSFQETWGDRLGWALFCHGYHEETVQEAIARSSDAALDEAAAKLRRIMADIRSEEMESAG